MSKLMSEYRKRDADFWTEMKLDIQVGRFYQKRPSKMKDRVIPLYCTWSHEDFHPDTEGAGALSFR